jgi:hypothetical protein
LKCWTGEDKNFELEECSFDSDVCAASNDNEGKGKSGSLETFVGGKHFYSSSFSGHVLRGCADADVCDHYPNCKTCNNKDGCNDWNV